MDGVWLPAGGRHAAVRGLPDSRHTPQARDCQGGGLFPLGPPPFTPGEQNANVCKAETEQVVPDDDAGSILHAVNVKLRSTQPTYYQ